jgi:hypothetical protein
MIARSGVHCAALALAAAFAVTATAPVRAAEPPLPSLVPSPTLSAFGTLTADHAPAPPALVAADPMQPGPTTTTATTATPAPPDAAAYPTKGGWPAALRSLAIPGWGQLHSGHKTQAAIFGMLELGTWIAFGTYRRQGTLRQESSFDTARLYAGIDLENQPEELRKLVGQYQSSDVYNQYVVLREATFFIEDPAEREAYIAEHSIPPDQAWAWTDYEDFSRYGEERRSSERAYQRSRYLLGFALVNRLVSAIAAARTAPVRPSDQTSSAEPGELRGRLEWGVVPGESGMPESRLAWVMGF